MANYLSITEARRRFLELADSLDQEPLYVTRHGRPVLVVQRADEPLSRGGAPAKQLPRVDTERDWPTAPARGRQTMDRAARLDLFDRATARMRSRAAARAPSKEPAERGWQRHDVYDRGRAG